MQIFYITKEEAVKTLSTRSDRFILKEEYSGNMTPPVPGEIFRSDPAYTKKLLGDFRSDELPEIELDLRYVLVNPVLEGLGLRPDTLYVLEEINPAPRKRGCQDTTRLVGKFDNDLRFYNGDVEMCRGGEGNAEVLTFILSGTYIVSRCQRTGEDFGRGIKMLGVVYDPATMRKTIQL